MNHEKVVVELELDDILPNRFQPRFKFQEQAITELAESIKEHGVIQPILVRRLGDKFEIIAGERRYKASLLAGKRTIPAIIAELNDKDSAEVALIENVQRQDLTPIEEAVSYRKILDMGYLTQEQLAEKLGKTQSTISNKLRLLNLDDDVQEALLDGKISERHARSLLKVESKQTQREILEKIIKDRLTVKKTDELIENVLYGKENLSSPSIFMNNSIQVEEPAIQSSSAIEFINPNENVVNSFSTETTKDDGLLDFLNVNNTQNNERVIPVENSNEIPEIPNIGLDDLNISDVQNFNSSEIPTSPIIEEVEEIISPSPSVYNNEQELREINEMINNIPNQINPGFVDVDTIEKNAQDIYVERPLADIDNLLMTSNGSGENSITSFENIKDINNIDEILQNHNEPVRENKFFTMIAPEEENTTVEENNEEEETFNFIPPVESTQSLNQFLNNDLTDTTVAPTQNEINNFEQTPITTTPELQIFGNAEQPVVQSSNLNINEFYDNQDTLEEIEDAPKVINYPQDNILAESIRKEEVTVKNEKEDNNIYAAVDLKTVINTIRNCADTIEKYGFALDCEEYDFEDMYQVIFKIQKNDK